MRNTFGFRKKSRDRQSGFTLLELMVVACIIAVLGAVLLNRVFFYQRMAEKTAMEQTVGILQSALQLRVTSLIASNRFGEMGDLVKQNPMQWLAQKPANYVGEYFDEVPDGDVSGQWYFDLKERSLVYFVHNRSTSKNADAVLPQIRFKTNLVLAVENSSVVERSTSGKVIEGVVLEQIVPYTWD